MVRPAKLEREVLKQMGQSAGSGDLILAGTLPEADLTSSATSNIRRRQKELRATGAGTLPQNKL